MSKVIHGHSRRVNGKHVFTKEYRAWVAMKNRCLNPNQARYADYGARGITVCDRWISGDGQRSGFECFLADLGNHPGDGYSLDRSENDLGYEPGNAHWATRSEQARNKRNTRIVEINGERVSFAEAVERFGCVACNVAAQRIHRGWTDIDAITTPLVHQSDRWRLDA